MAIIRRSHYQQEPGKNVLFSVENKWRLLPITLYSGFGFAESFFIV
ncbi:cytochrome c oxidase subunit 7C, mitochondrial-like [Ochotona curzoniae]|nr:cytochrome c oxidase subunit 7C, mitochondrial-like [Ochotona curzoniae]